MSALQGYLEKLGGNFLVASFIPSLAFVIVSMLTITPIIPPKVLLHIQFLLNPLGELGVVIILIAVIIGFTLTSLNTQVYKIFEGYVFFNQLSFFRKQEIRRARELRLERNKISRRLIRFENELAQLKKLGELEQEGKGELSVYINRQKEKVRNRVGILKAQEKFQNTLYDQRYPPQESLILPTRLGNILRAAESYPRTRYDIDAVSMWPRIIYAASTADKGDSFLAKVDFSNDQCSFLLNTSLLSGIYAGVTFIASLYQYLILYLCQIKVTTLLYFISIDPIPEIYTQRAVIYLIFGCGGLLSMWLFYNASLLNVSAYGNLIRSTYDLFRFNLLEVLHLPLPATNEADPDDDSSGTPIDARERVIWSKVSEFFNSYDATKSPIYFEYDHSKKPLDSE